MTQIDPLGLFRLSVVEIGITGVSGTYTLGANQTTMDLLFAGSVVLRITREATDSPENGIEIMQDITLSGAVTAKITAKFSLQPGEDVAESMFTVYVEKSCGAGTYEYVVRCDRFSDKATVKVIEQ